MSESIPWEDISSAASKMFNVWVLGGELEWARECWEHLDAAGLVSQEPSFENTRSLLRLVALAKIYQEFSGAAWDEDPETPLDYLAEGLELDPVAIGILAARAEPDNSDWDGDDYELRDYALTVVTNSMRKEIYACLRKAYGGDEGLYSRMFQTHKAEEISDEEEGAEEFEATGMNARALDFVMSGFR